MSGTEPEAGSGSHPPLPPNAPKIPGITLHYELARGGMGVVYSGRQDFLDRRVAVKLLSLDLAGEQFAQRFRREAKILAGIKHPHIVACHSAGITPDGQSYLVMEFVDGPNLKSWISSHGPMHIAASLRLAKAVAQALAYALQLGVIHRDVKPENILLEGVTSTAIDIAFPYVPKLVDLGLARNAGETAGLGLTSPGSVMGTPATMSPEQFDDPDAVDFRSDIYGLGCALYEMLVGLPAYRGTKLTDIVVRKRQPIGPNPCAENPRVPAVVGDFVSVLLAADREQRPRSYKELEERIDALMSALPSEQARGFDSLNATAATIAGFSPTPTAKATGRPAPVPTSPAPPAPGAPTGPGLLRTAEMDFLQQGLEARGGGAATAFRDGGTAAPVAPAGTTGSGEVQKVPGPRRNKRAMMIGAIGVIAVGGVVLLIKLMGGGPAGSNQRPVAEIRCEDRVPLLKWVTLSARATDAEGDPLVYDWSSPFGEITFRGNGRASTSAQIADGLPGESFAISVSVSDGVNEPVIAQKVVTVDDYPGRPLLLGFDMEGSDWQVDPAPKKPFWTQIQGYPVVSCRTHGVLRTMSKSMGEETFWQITGRLHSRVDDASNVFAKTAVRLELGDQGWSIVCSRSGDMGERWSVRLTKDRRANGVWTSEPDTRTLPIEWIEPEDATDADFPYAEVSVARRRDKLLLRWGQQAAKYEQREVPLAGFRGEPRISLWVDGGAGEFREFVVL